jgi:hypothetical protein
MIMFFFKKNRICVLSNLFGSSFTFKPSSGRTYMIVDCYVNDMC